METYFMISLKGMMNPEIEKLWCDYCQQFITHRLTTPVKKRALLLEEEQIELEHEHSQRLLMDARLLGSLNIIFIASSRVFYTSQLSSLSLTLPRSSSLFPALPSSSQLFPALPSSS
jgi:hypothetical protein